MRLLHVITGFQVGGAEKLAADLAVELVGRGHVCRIVAVLSFDPDDAIGTSLRRHLESNGVDTDVLGAENRRMGLVRAGCALAKAVGKWKPDLVHSHTDIPDFVVSIARRLRRFRIARTIQNTELWPTRPIVGKFCESALRDDLVISSSVDAGQAYRDMRQRFGLPESAHHSVIYNSVRPSNSGPPIHRQDLGDKLGADTAKHLFCFIGRITAQKGLDILIEAIERLPKQALEQFELYVFGDGEDRLPLETRSTVGGLPVRFLGEMPNAGRFLPAFDAVLLPSRFEGLPLVMLEAMEVGTLAIVTTAPGLRDAIPANWPLAAEPENAMDLASKIQDFLDDRFDVKALSRQLIEYSRNNFSYERMVTEYEQAYANYLGKAPSSRDAFPS